MQYKDQLDEINLLTGRIHALSDALEAKGFYPAGGAELAEAVQAAVTTHASGRLLVPISNWAAFGGTKEIIVWLPIDMIATTITALVMLRKQIIEDIYQITGMADIMRGDTDPNETLGAQKLKNQYGTTRIRDKQKEMVRVARDLVEIISEIITEKFDDETIVMMSQTQLRTQEMVRQDAEQIQQQLQQIQQQAEQAIQQAQQQQPQLAPPQQGPAQAPGSPPAATGSPGPGAPAPTRCSRSSSRRRGAMQQGMQQLQQLNEEVTIEQVLYFLKDSRAKAFTLDIETDSTIMADEDGEKQRRTEFTQVLGGLLPQLAQMITGRSEDRAILWRGAEVRNGAVPRRSLARRRDRRSRRADEAEGPAAAGDGSGDAAGADRAADRGHQGAGGAREAAAGRRQRPGQAGAGRPATSSGSWPTSARSPASRRSPRSASSSPT